MIWMLHIGRAGHPGPGKRCFTPGQLSVEFVNVCGWLTYGDLAWVPVLSSWRLLSTGYSLEGPGLFVISFVRLGISLFGPLLVRIWLLGDMLELG